MCLMSEKVRTRRCLRSRSCKATSHARHDVGLLRESGSRSGVHKVVPRGGGCVDRELNVWPRQVHVRAA